MSLRRTLIVPALVAVSVGSAATPVAASGHGHGRPDRAMQHVGTFFVDDNLHDGEPVATPTSAEIVDMSKDGRTLVYTDALTSRLGIVDVRNPSRPKKLGAIDLPGGPTSVAIIGDYAAVAVVTSDDFTQPAGRLVVIDLKSRRTVREIDLGGQPDSIALAPSGRYAAITIENERDEDVNDGLIPQLPAGFLQIVDLRGSPSRWTTRQVAMTGLADDAPSDPEPEYVDINRRDQAVVSLQENNHLAIVDLRTAKVTNDFTAGAVDIDHVDTTEEELGPQGVGLISLDGSLTGRRREPDAVQWIDDDTFATANEGDYVDEQGIEGGSRSWTIFDTRGRVRYEAGNSLEHEIVRAGHYPEGRSENKGNEPEGLEVAKIGGRTYLFVASERADAVGVYDVSGRTPEFVQLLPTGIGPEGMHVEGGVLAVTSETDGAAEGFLARPIITLFELNRGAPSYPYIESADDAAGLPIPWVALSGLSADPEHRDVMWTVSDSALAQPYLYRVDTSDERAVITDRIPVGGVDVGDEETGDYDFEGVAARPEGGFWLASEGRTNPGSSRPNLLVRAAADGSVLRAVRLPDALVANATSSGFEGVTVTGSEAARDEVVWVAVQRGWADDPTGLVKIGRYDVASATWTFAHYQLDAPVLPAGGFMGLSEITALTDGTLAVIERDNQMGQDAQIKRIYTFDPESVTFASFGQPLPVLSKQLLADVLPTLDDASIRIPDKLEGFTVTRDRRMFIVTDNDGVDENDGATVFLQIGRLGRS